MANEIKVKRIFVSLWKVKKLELVDELLKWERDLSHVLQTAIMDDTIPAGTETIGELIQVRDDLRKRVRELGYEGHF